MTTKKASAKGAKKKAQPAYEELQKENRRLRRALDGIWDALVDIGDNSIRDHALNAVDEAAEIVSKLDPQKYRIDYPEDEATPEQPRIGYQSLAPDAVLKGDEATDSIKAWRENTLTAVLEFGQKIGGEILQGDELETERQKFIQGYLPDAVERREFAGSLFLAWLQFISRLPVDVRAEVEDFIQKLEEWKKVIPKKKTGPEADVFVTRAMEMRDTTQRPYKEIYNELLKEYREAMISRGFTPESLGARVRTRKSRLLATQRRQKPADDDSNRHG